MSQRYKRKPYFKTVIVNNELHIDVDKLPLRQRKGGPRKRKSSKTTESTAPSEPDNCPGEQSTSNSHQQPQELHQQPQELHQQPQELHQQPQELHQHEKSSEAANYVKASIKATRSMSLSEGFVKLVQFANKFYSGTTRLTSKPFIIAGKQVGLIPPEVLPSLCGYPQVFKVHRDTHTDTICSVELCQSLDTYEERSKRVAEILQEWRMRKLFVSLKGWRDECYDVVHKFSEPPLMKMERSATSLFGVKQYGVHINGYLRHPEKGLCMWIGKRSPNKQTWPNLHDQMAAGGYSTGLGILECARKECQEEASVPDHILDKLKPVGTVSYMFQDERGIFPECQFVFDLEVPHDFIPINADGEVQSFQLLPIEKVKELIVEESFKFNCGVVCLDFMIRHSVILPDQEPNYSYLVENMHVQLP